MLSVWTLWLFCWTSDNDPFMLEPWLKLTCCVLSYLRHYFHNAFHYPDGFMDGKFSLAICYLDNPDTLLNI